MARNTRVNSRQRTHVAQPSAKNGIRKTRRARNPELLGRYIVADPKICYGKPTFRGTRILVWQVLEMLAEGLAWETIIYECHNSITKDAIAEAIRLSGEAFLKHSDEFALKPVAA